MSRRCPRPEEELVVVVFAMLPSSEQRAVGRAATGQRAGEQRATNLPTCAGEPPRCCSFQPIILPQSLSSLSAAAQVDKTRGRES